MRWKTTPSPDFNKVKTLSNSLNVEPQIASLLVQKGIETFEEAKKFFRPDLSNLHNPYLMKDMDKAVSRITAAFKNKETIMVYGDYDVDGTTAVSLVSSYLKTIYNKVTTYIPDRYDEGYGISFKGIDFANDNDISLIIALDCGIKAVDKVEYALKKNIDFIICDHHIPGKKIPKAVAILDPKRKDCTYPFNELCGCGIGFKLIQALASNFGNNLNELTSYLDLVAISIAADIVPITGENRILTHYGLIRINENPRAGIKAIINQLNKKNLTITDVVFTIAPRINAAGRMKHGLYAVELLTEPNLKKATILSNEIEKFNNDRKLLDKKIATEAIKQIEDNNEQNKVASVVYKESWHKGVIGIVASRMIEKYYRPTLVFTKSGNVLAASARSIKGFDLYNALEACSEYIEQFGGHKYAAGLTIKPENYDLFKQKFEKIVKSTITPEMLIPEINIASSINLTDITPKFCRILKLFAPFGPQNMKPVFMSSNLRDNGYSKQVGEDKNHLKLCIINGSDQRTYNAIGFGLGYKYDIIKNGFKAAYTIEENNWNGIISLQLSLKDIKED